MTKRKTQKQPPPISQKLLSEIKNKFKFDKILVLGVRNLGQFKDLYLAVPPPVDINSVVEMLLAALDTIMAEQKAQHGQIDRGSLH